MTRGRSLRRAGAVDAALLGRLHRECFASDRDGEAWGTEAMAGLITAPGHFALIAQEAERPIGFVLARRVSDQAEILSLGVPAAARRRGIATALLAGILGFLVAQGARQVFLEVAEDNEGAQALYRSLGFSPTGRRLAYYARADGRVDAVVYHRELGAGVDTIPY